MSKMRFWLLAPITLMTVLFLTGCEEEEAQRVAAAQQCLNEMNSSMTSAELTTKAAECRTILGSVTTENGFIIECSSYFLEEGFFGSQIIEAFDRAGDETNAENDVLNIVSTFAFKSEANATAVDNACSQTGSRTFAVFGELAKMATTIGAAFTGGLAALIPTDGTIPDFNDFKDALNNVTDFEALGDSVVDLGTILCADNADLGNEICPTIEGVSAAGNNAAIGQCLQECMANSALATCPSASVACK